MSNSESKDRIIGLLASAIIHAILITLGFWLLNEQKNSSTKVERKTLNLSQFKSQTDKTSKPSAATKPTPKQIQKPNRQTKVQKKEPPLKETPKAKTPIKQAKQTEQTEQTEQNITAKLLQQAASKPSGSAKLFELNNQMKAAKKEVGGPIKKLYGEDFERLGEEEQKFIKDNLSSIGRITEKYMKYPDVAAQFRQEGTSLVEFYLYPNGDIDGMRLITSSGYKSLDKSAMESIWIAYKDYPRPSTKTLIRIYMQYSIY